MQPAISLTLPAWLDAAVAAAPAAFPSVESRVLFAISLARENLRQGTGGPFGAAVFDIASGALIAAGVNLVVSASCSVLHAEIVALIGAQHTLRTYDLGLSEQTCELASSAEPCAMCLGAIPWSGVKRLSCGARGDDVEAIGFDEGAKPRNWIHTLTTRGIEVVVDVHREDAAAVLRAYADSGGPIYNTTP